MTDTQPLPLFALPGIIMPRGKQQIQQFSKADLNKNTTRWLSECVIPHVNEYHRRGLAIYRRFAPTSIHTPDNSVKHISEHLLFADIMNMPFIESCKVSANNPRAYPQIEVQLIHQFSNGSNDRRDFDRLMDGIKS